jgi:hypothetical protein
MTNPFSATVSGPVKVLVVEEGVERLAFSIEAGAKMELYGRGGVYDRLGFNAGERHVVFRHILEAQVDIVTITGPVGGADIHTETPPPYQT